METLLYETAIVWDGYLEFKNAYDEALIKILKKFIKKRDIKNLEFGGKYFDATQFLAALDWRSTHNDCHSLRLDREWHDNKLLSFDFDLFKEIAKFVEKGSYIIFDDVYSSKILDVPTRSGRTLVRWNFNGENLIEETVEFTWTVQIIGGKKKPDCFGTEQDECCSNGKKKCPFFNACFVEYKENMDYMG